MKINPIVNPNVLRSYQASRPGLEKSSVASKRDELTLSSEALSFSKALADAKSEIEFRSVEEKAHIANIKDSVSKGQYKIDSNLVAQRILDDLVV
jgi:anti-sigma28 factor (negative regulator of flagellin synthesis)